MEKLTTIGFSKEFLFVSLLKKSFFVIWFLWNLHQRFNLVEIGLNVVNFFEVLEHGLINVCIELKPLQLFEGGLRQVCVFSFIACSLVFKLDIFLGKEKWRISSQTIGCFSFKKLIFTSQFLTYFVSVYWCKPTFWNICK